MKCKGEIKNLSLDWKTQRPEITLQIEAKAEDIERLMDKELSVELKQYKQKRSLDANSYYWVLCTKIAEKLREPVPFIHNMLLRKYGQPEIIDGHSVLITIPDTDEAAMQVDEAETYHLEPTSDRRLGNDGQMYLTYKMLRGSHTYNTAEMSRLIDGVIAEAQKQGIETQTEDQKREMMALYEKHCSR